ncbi:hypothetical protein DPMN_009824 [Dreissena polymorpha]|uniref:Uncharacterized protein n=1 Tax=Dreissena polymorpha TaxID=45954 RepID=A0A9D4S0E0_DREPO|nr:hypothetical protein DPMN_009824 [Dreissena polymorpha]
MLLSNNVNLRCEEQYAIDTIQQQLLSGIPGFGVAALELAPFLFMIRSEQQQQQHEQQVVFEWCSGI